MFNNIFKRFSFPLFASLLFALILSTESQAQVTVTGSVTLSGKDVNGNVSEEKVQGVIIFYFSTKESAQDFMKKFKNASNLKLDGTEGAHKVETNSSGEFSCEMIVGSYLLFYHPEQKNNPRLRGPVTQSNNRFDEKFQTEGKIIPPININAKSIVPPGIKTGRTRVFGDTISWTCNFYLPEGYANKESRLIIQPYAVSCQDETDTVAYLKPIVMEGEEYHTLQDKRKDYGYNPNDPLHDFYDPTHVLSKDSLRITKVITFKRPDAQKLYFCPARTLLEDYTHILWQNDKDEAVFGSCEVITPFKFLEFKLKSSEIPLTREEFYEVPSTKFRKVDRNLQLRFDKGRATFTSDSINDLTMLALAEELNSYKKNLVEVRIIGTASPDGGLAINQRLAKQRADAALNRVRSYVSGNHFQRKSESKVYTWKEVSDSLQLLGYTEESAKLREAADKFGDYDNRAYAVAKAFSIFSDVVEPILEKQRAMVCSYNYTNNSALTPEEAVHSWFNDPEYQEKGSQRFSNGDYFNLLTLIKDSTEQRKIVERAYREITKVTGFQHHAFSAYIANRMAVYALADGIIDTTVLKPFIDLETAKSDVKKQISFYNTDRWTVNRSQILVNQGLMYLKAGKLGHSEFLINKLPASAEIKREIKYYYDMINYIMHFDDPNTTEEEKRNGHIGLNFVMKSSKINEAVLKSELTKELEIDRLVALTYVDSLPDSNPKKWYLKGMLLSEYAGKEEEFIAKTQKDVINLYEAMLQGLTPDDLTAENVDNYRLLTKDEDMDVPFDKSNDLQLLVNKFNELKGPEEKPVEKKKENKTPHFLAYFQQSFDMAPKYKEYYSHEGNIERVVFKKHPYKKEEAEVYRDKFRELVPNFNATEKAEAKQTEQNVTDSDSTNNGTDSITEQEHPTNE